LAGSSPQDFPLDVVPETDLTEFFDFVPRFFHESGLPLDGLTDAESAVVLQEFHEGVAPRELRRRRDEPLT
jgi:hypothetical protein